MTRRVLFAPRNTSGQAAEYAAALRSRGYETEVWSYGPVAFGFTADRVIDRDRVRTDNTYQWQLFDEAVRRFDIFHFQFSGSLVLPRAFTLPELWDLPVLKALGKRIFMHFRGSDVRLKSVHMEREPDSYFRHSNLACDEERIKTRISVSRRFCDALFVSTPGLLDYVPDAVWIPHALNLDDWSEFQRREAPTPMVLHIPSHRGTKGSDFVDEPMRHLDRAGLCRYVELTHVDRPTLVKTIRQADIVIDSLGIGDHGLISVEAMAAGAVAVCHIHERNRQRNPGVPVVEATVSTLHGVVRELCQDADRRRLLSEEGRKWVRSMHSRELVGDMLAAFYERDVQQPFLSHPQWPQSGNQRRVEKLEKRVELLTRNLNARRLFPPGIKIRPTFGPYVEKALIARVVEAERRLQASNDLPHASDHLSSPADGNHVFFQQTYASVRQWASDKYLLRRFYRSSRLLLSICRKPWNRGLRRLSQKLRSRRRQTPVR